MHADFALEVHVGYAKYLKGLSGIVKEQTAKTTLTVHPLRAPAVHVLSCVSKYLIHRTKPGTKGVNEKCVSFLHRALGAHLRDITTQRPATKWLQEIFDTSQEIEARDTFDDHGDLVESSPEDDSSVAQAFQEEKLAHNYKDTTDSDTSDFDGFQSIRPVKKRKQSKSSSFDGSFSDEELDDMVEHAMVEHEITRSIKELAEKAHKSTLEPHPMRPLVKALEHATNATNAAGHSMAHARSSCSCLNMPS